jgi:hypothetical protein
MILISLFGGLRENQQIPLCSEIYSIAWFEYALFFKPIYYKLKRAQSY